MNADLRGLSDIALTKAEDKYYELAPFNGPDELREGLRTVIGAYLSVAQGQGFVQYRELGSNDTLLADDEFLDDDCITWLRVGDRAKLFVGNPYNRGFYKAVRRKLPAAPAQPDGVGK